jgi:hypothetical protein
MLLDIEELVEKVINDKMQENDLDHEHFLNEVKHLYIKDFQS